jgi:branched-chain amino acid transport system substrate-binding protein
MWKGARAAYKHSVNVDGTDEYTLTPIDDCGKRGLATAKAERIQNAADVIAVIGHATSGTTRSAAYLYDQVGIPLVAPIATSPYAFHPPGKTANQEKLKNFVRLPPSDKRAQAPAAAMVATELLKGKEIFIIGDKSSDAWEYAKPLYNEALSIIPETRITDNNTIKDKAISLERVAGDVLVQDTDVVIFAGYGTTAEKFLYELAQAYEAKDRSDVPGIVLTDGAMTGDISKQTLNTFNIRITFPIPDVSKISCGGEDYKNLKNILNKSNNKSFQMFAYDAVLMADKAISQCSQKNISRDCVEKKLRELRDFNGVCSTYSFQNGENMLSNYYVYSNVYGDVRRDSLHMVSTFDTNKLVKY